MKTLITPANLSTTKIEIANLGRKAYYLAKLKSLESTLGCKTPDFVIIPASQIDIEWASLAQKIQYDTDPKHPFRTLSDNVTAFHEIYDRNAPTFDKAFEIYSSDTNYPVLKTSLMVDQNQKLSFAGINFSTYPDGKFGSDFVRESVADNYAGLVKPLTNWYLRRNAIWNPERHASMYFVRFIQTVGIGTLISEEGNIAVAHNAVDGGKTMLKVDKGSWATENITLAADLKELIPCVQPLTDLMGENFEAEYRLGKDGNTYITQVRTTYPVARTAQYPDESYVDLRDLKKSNASDIFNGLVRNPVCGLIVHHKDREMVDAFYALSRLQDQDAQSCPALHVMKKSPNDFDHLETLLKEDKRIAKLSFGYNS